MTVDANPFKSPVITEQPGTEPAEGKVLIELDKKWIARVQSPLYWVVAALTGVSISFAPLGLLAIGQMDLPPRLYWLSAMVCFAVIFLVPLWYIRLAGEVIKSLRKHRLK